MKKQKNLSNKIKLRELKQKLEYIPETFLTDDGTSEGFLNKLKVFKVTILPVGNSLGHTALMYTDEVLSQNKLDLIKMLGRIYKYYVDD